MTLFIEMWFFSLFFGGNRVLTFFFALSTMMFVVDRYSVKYAIHTKDHSQSMYDVLLWYYLGVLSTLIIVTLRKNLLTYCGISI